MGAKKFGDALSDAVALSIRGFGTFRCPEPGCNFRIRFRGMPVDEVARWKDIAEDHSKHHKN